MGSQFQGNPACIGVQSWGSKLSIPDNSRCQGKDVSTKAVWSERTWGEQGGRHAKRVQEELVMRKVEPVGELGQGSQAPGRVQAGRGFTWVSAKPCGSSYPCILLFLCSAGAFQSDVTKESGMPCIPCDWEKGYHPSTQEELPGEQTGGIQSPAHVVPHLPVEQSRWHMPCTHLHHKPLQQDRTGQTARAGARPPLFPECSLDTQSMATALQLVSPGAIPRGWRCPWAMAQEGSEHPAQGDTDSSSTQGLLSPTCSWAEGGEIQQTLRCKQDWALQKQEELPNSSVG